MGYATEAELEAITARDFSATTPVTSTQIAAFLTQISALLDALHDQDEGDFGAETTCEEWVKQAVLAASAYRIDCIYYRTIHDPEKVIQILRSYSGKKGTTNSGAPSYSNLYNDGSGDSTTQSQD